MTAREAVSGLTGTTSPTFTVAAPQATTELNFHDGSPAEQLEATLRKQVLNAIDAVQSGLKTYESLRNLSEVIGGEYGDRVIFELVQNAHDAHCEGDQGTIFLKLDVISPSEGHLYVANGGQGFTWDNVNAIRNVGVSSKSVGEGIGNKGLGFRSVETLTDDPRIYSQQIAQAAKGFTGFCFRFARSNEVLAIALELGPASVAAEVAATLPRYLAAVPIDSQDRTIRSFARQGFATVVHIPLQNENAVSVAKTQVRALLEADAQLLLFLDRLANVRIEIQDSAESVRKTLTRTVLQTLDCPEGARNRYQVVSVDPGNRRYLIASSLVNRAGLLEAVDLSVAKEPQLARWREWRGEPRVAIAVPLGAVEPDKGRIYNFLPMSTEMVSPLGGHIDAPFYASIDRRRANFSLPLNAYLLDCLAEASANAAQDIKALGGFDRDTIFDFAAWDFADSSRIEKAWKTVGVDWKDVKTIPAAGTDDSWTSIEAAWTWAEAGYRLFRARRLVKAGIQDLADPALGTIRLARLTGLIEAANVISSPNADTLAGWAEAVATSLHDEKASSTTWSTFYDEIHRAFPNTHTLQSLRTKRFLKGRDGSLHTPKNGDSERPVFIRQDGVSKARDRDRAPLPPNAISRQLAILSEDIAPSPGVIEAFLRAQLVERYDPIQLLLSLETLFGEKPAPARREAALKWAFEVWRRERAKSEKVLSKIDLHVETRAGWQPASVARFSDNWTNDGRKLATYLAESAAISPDCERAAAYLLLEDPNWALRSESGRKEWLEFLRAVGVRDGLPLLSDEEVPRSGFPIYTWNHFLQTAAPARGLSAHWNRINANVHLPNPHTDYRRRGELWRFPGQVEHDSLPPEARQRLADLILAQLKNKDLDWLSWHLGRYERWGADQNERTFHTPAAAFAMREAWLPVEDSEEQFERASHLWITSDRRQRPPRFVHRPRERLATVIEDDDNLTKLMLGPKFELRDWASSANAIRKLADLARAIPRLEPRERPNFRRAYQRAWTQAIEIQAEIPPKHPLAATVRGELQIVLPANPETRIYLAADVQGAEARAVAAAGQPVLDLGDEDLISPAIDMLRATGGFDPCRADRGQIEVLVDGESFDPRLSDPLVASNGLEWIAEVAALGNELLGRELERQISAASIEEKFRRLRLHFCDRIALAVNGVEIDETLQFYAYADEQFPTLIVGDGETLTWPTLADAAPFVSNLVDRRMRSLETVLLRLAAHGASEDPHVRPSDAALAKALQCKVEVIHEHLSALRTDGAALVARLLPVLVCALGLDEARIIEAKIDEHPTRSDLIAMLAPFESRLPASATDCVETVLSTTDLAEIRRRLGLEFSALNKALQLLGVQTLSNEPELRRLFDTWKDELGPSAIDRLRRHYWSQWESGDTLTAYVEQRSLDFIEFQQSWILELEHLERSRVRDLIELRFTALFGPDNERQLGDLSSTRNRSRKVIQRLAEDGAKIVGAWCHQNDTDHGVWADGSLAVVKAVDLAGLFDFAAVEPAHGIATLMSAGVWPSGMPQTLELQALGLTADDLMGEKKREDEQREAEARKRRTIRFAETELDTGARDFSEQLIRLAQMQMIDGQWLKRSRRRFSLAEIARQGSSGPGGKGGKGGRGKRVDRLSDDVKGAMGFASEYLASQYLASKHRERFNETCWVSRNREGSEVAGEGDDSLGFDFRVRTADVEWRYEVKSNQTDLFEFEFTQNEMRVAGECAGDGSRKYRILYVPFVFQPGLWRVMELPNPMSEAGRALFRAIGSGSTRYRFEPK